MPQLFPTLDGLSFFCNSTQILAADAHSLGQSAGLAGLAIAFVALTVMEIVLGIDNIVFLSIVTGKLPHEEQKKARFIGLSLALVMRVLLLMLIQYIAGLTAPVIELNGWLPFLNEWLSADANKEINNISWRDMILLSGGLFLLYKSVVEIDHHIAGQHDTTKGPKKVTFTSAILQIIVLDLIFSLDSVITAVGMVNELPIMIAAVVVAIIVMMVFAGKIAAFIDVNPTIKMLALSFLLMIGIMLVAEGCGTHINKGYIYFAMTFSLLVEILNLRARAKAAQAESVMNSGV